MSVHKLQRAESGQAFVEFALVIGILAALVLSIIAIWPIINSHDAIAMAAASGAHEAAITGGDETQIRELVQANLESVGLGIDPDSVQITVQCTQQCRRYDPITVSVSTHVKPWIDLPWFRNQYTISAQYTRASELDGIRKTETGSGSGGGPSVPIPGPDPNREPSSNMIPGTRKPTIPGATP